MHCVNRCFLPQNVESRNVHTNKGGLNISERSARVQQQLLDEKVLVSGVGIDADVGELVFSH